MEKIHFVTIATNIYIGYFRNLVESIHAAIPDAKNIYLHVFTNEVEKAVEIASEYPSLSIEITEISNLTWPEATLSRYMYISKVASSAEGVVAYLDADMLVNADIRGAMVNASRSEQMVFVEHPGFWRPKGKARIGFYLLHPSYLIRDLLSSFILGGIGAWETSKKSVAYVPRRKRRQYLCGGFWFGAAKASEDFCAQQMESVNKDSKNSVVAKWHDESHLNEWASRNAYQFLSPEYCYSETALNLNSLEPLVIAVEKKVRTR